MNWRFKLSIRLALLRNAVLAAAAFTACTADRQNLTEPASVALDSTYIEGAWRFNPSVGSVTVAPTTASLAVGGSVDLVATVTSTWGTTIYGRTIAWTTGSTSVATVSSTGRVTGIAAGVTTIRATTAGKTGTATVTVTAAPSQPPAVATVTVAPSTSTVAAGATVQFTATTKGSEGMILDRVVTWASNAAAVATISSTGLVTGVGAGTAMITATSEGRSATATVTVTSPPAQTVPVATVSVGPANGLVLAGNTIQMFATTKDAAGNTLTGRVVAWSSNATGVATVTSAGVVRGVTAGTAVITASSEGKSGTATVTVTVPPPVPAPVATVAVSPSSATFGAGATLQLTATMKDAAGVTLTGRVVTWSSNATGVATVSSSGLVSRVAAGTAVITATSEGKSGAATVTVPVAAPAPVATVAVSPTTTTISAGATSQLTATTKDAAGTTLVGRVVTWTSNAAGIATVSSTGLVSGVAAGSAVITATSEGRTATANVTVTAVVPPPPGGFATPNILNNASFETGFDGFVTGSGTSPTGATRSQDRSSAGTWSLKQSWNNNTSDVSAQAFFDLGANRTQVFARTYFYQTAWPNGGGYKFFRLQDAGYNTTTGIQVLNGRLAWITGNAGYIAMAYIGSGLPSTNAWHSIEFELNTVTREVRVWVDGVAQSFTVYYDPSADLTVSGTTLRYSDAVTVAPARYLDLVRVINPSTNSGSAYFDRIAASTQRIGQ